LRPPGPGRKQFEMWIDDPDGVRTAVVEAPDDHPLRRDQR
jgi:hypothetical protein